MTFANDQKRIAYFLETLRMVPHYDCPERGTVRVLIEGGLSGDVDGFVVVRFVVVHTGPESLVSWTARHFAKVDTHEERERRFRVLHDSPDRARYSAYLKTISHVISK